MPNAKERNEYVENDAGKVYKGTYKHFNGTPWIFGQFEESVLPACCLLLDNSGLNSGERGDPVKVSRAISAMVNSNDDSGVLIGKWGAPYDDGTAPWDWSGSVPILEEYMKNKGTPVSRLEYVID